MLSMAITGFPIKNGLVISSMTDRLVKKMKMRLADTKRLAGAQTLTSAQILADVQMLVGVKKLVVAERSANIKMAVVIYHKYSY